MGKVLIADDHAQITSVLKAYAEKEGHAVAVAKDGGEALKLFHSFEPDLVLLDVMMPVIDGFEVCRRIRERSGTPVIMITARGEDFERIMGLDIGADDYIVKPFSPGEVMARVRAVLRRLEKKEGRERQLLSLGSLTVDLDDYRASVGGTDVPLTKKELDLLWTLAAGRGKVFSRENLLNALWGYDYFGDTRTVDSHIKRLRAKLDTLPHPDWEIRTVWGVGYKLEAAPSDENDRG